MDHFARSDLTFFNTTTMSRMIAITVIDGFFDGFGLGIGKTVIWPKFLRFGIRFKNYNANCRSSSFSSSC